MDSRQWWSRAYAGHVAPVAAVLSDFAVALTASLPEPCRILELGCGPGSDSAYFARLGHLVVGADFIRLDAAWRQAPGASGPSLSPSFIVLDLRSDLPFANESFDVVYARLSLHYFSDEATNRIFGEVHRVLVAGGLFAFLCKSTEDPGCGRGEPVGPNMFRVNDKVYHFFDEAFTRQCLRDRFQIEEIWSGPMETYGEPSAVVRVRARKSARIPPA